MYRRTVLRKPPRIKYLEAAGAIADDRVKVVEKGPSKIRAIVRSSMGDKVYSVVVKWRGKEIEVYSNDNGTMLRGYVGYPILSLMMLTGLLKRDETIENALRGIPWKALNERLKRYRLVEEEVYKIAMERGVTREQLEDFIHDNTKMLEHYSVLFNPSLVESESERRRGSLLDYM